MRAVRLDGADVSRDHRNVKRVQEVVLRAGEGELVGCEVAERMDRPAGGFQTLEQRDVLARSGRRASRSNARGRAQLAGELGKGLGPRLDRGGEIGRGVGMGDEIHGERG